MSLVNRIKARILNLNDDEEITQKTKKQYNVVIEKELIAEIRYLASRCDSNRSATAEHLLEVGCFYLGNALDDRNKREIVVEHIRDKHLLGILGAADDPAILVLGETTDYWQLLELSKPVLRAYKKCRRAMEMTRKTGNFSYMQQARDGLLIAAIDFAMYLQKQSLGTRSDSEIDQSHQEQQPQNG